MKQKRKDKIKVKQRIEKMASFTSLPDSVIIQILSYLDYPLLVRSTRVCTRWHRLCYDPSLWKSLHIRTEHTSKMVDETIAKLIPHKTNLISSVNLVDCPGLKDDSLVHISLNCPNLRKLFLTDCHFITDTGIFALARNCNVLETVSLLLRNISAKALVSLVENNPGIRKLYASSTAVTENTIKAISTGCPQLDAKGFSWISPVGHILVLVPRFDHEFVTTFQGHGSVGGKNGHLICNELCFQQRPVSQ